MAGRPHAGGRERVLLTVADRANQVVVSVFPGLVGFLPKMPVIISLCKLPIWDHGLGDWGKYVVQTVDRG